MNELLRDRILRRIETLSDDRLYQVLDYVEFLESKYAQRQPLQPNVFQRFAEGVEDTMRAGRISATTISETMSFMNKTMGVLSGVAAAGKSVATDVVTAASRPPSRPTGAPESPAARPPQATPPSSDPATDPSGGPTT